MKTLIKRMGLPLYGKRYTLVVCDDYAEERPKHNKALGVDENPKNCMGCVCWADDYRELYLFLTRNEVSHNLIAHETFHLAHRVAEYYGINFDPNNHEPVAHICGALTGQIYGQLNRWKVKIK